MKRIFHPGEEWLYLRLYMGPETAASWLANILPPLLKELKRQGMVRNCFYLHYLDSAFQLRIRFKIIKQEFCGHVLLLCNKFSANLFEDDLIWKSELASYEREIERYGEDWIETAEEIFCIDTSFWLEVLPWIYNHNNGENIRWQISFLSVHQLLNDFSYQLESRAELFGKMAEALSREINGGKKLRIQIDERYRSNRLMLDRIITEPDRLMSPEIVSALKHRTDSIKEILITDDKLQYWDQKLLQTRMSDLIHLSLNRGLRSKYRMQELVLYSFLKKFYVSAKARSLPLC